MSSSVPAPLRPRLLLGLSVQGDAATAAARLSRVVPPVAAADHLLAFADELESAMCPRMAARARRIAAEIVAEGYARRRALGPPVPGGGRTGRPRRGAPTG